MRRRNFVVRRNFEKLARDEPLGAQYRMVTAFKRGRNLQDM